MPSRLQLSFPLLPASLCGPYHSGLARKRDLDAPRHSCSARPAGSGGLRADREPPSATARVDDGVRRSVQAARRPRTRLLGGHVLAVGGKLGVEPTPADPEDPRGALLVALRDLEGPDDEQALGLGQRGTNGDPQDEGCSPPDAAPLRRAGPTTSPSGPAGVRSETRSPEAARVPASPSAMIRARGPPRRRAEPKPEAAPQSRRAQHRSRAQKRGAAQTASGVLTCDAGRSLPGPRRAAHAVRRDASR